MDNQLRMVRYHHTLPFPDSDFMLHACNNKKNLVKQEIICALRLRKQRHQLPGTAIAKRFPICSPHPPARRPASSNSLAVASSTQAAAQKAAEIDRGRREAEAVGLAAAAAAHHKVRSFLFFVQRPSLLQQ